MCSGVEVRGVVLDQTVDNDGEELWGEVGVVTIGLRYDVDERGVVCREDSVSCREESVDGLGTMLLAEPPRGGMLPRSIPAAG